MAVHVFNGIKGGVGKSMLAAAWGEYALNRGVKVAVVETDTNNGDVDRYFKDVAPVEKIDLRDRDGWVEFLSYLGRESCDDIVVALASGVGIGFAANAERVVLALAEAKRRMTMWWPMDVSPDCITLLSKVAKAYEPEAPVQFVAVRNLHFGVPSRFGRWNDSGRVRKDFLAAGGIELDFEELHYSVVDATFRAVPARRFSANGDTLEIGSRIERDFWMREMMRRFDAVAEKTGIGRR